MGTEARYPRAYAPNLRLLGKGEITMRGLISCCVGVVIAAFGAMPASASDDAIAKCQSTDPAVAIPGCTAVIGSSDVPPHLRAAAYAQRGMRTRDTDRQAAVRDFTAAIALYEKLEPRNPTAKLHLSQDTSHFYALRGREYYALYDYKRARADLDRAIALDKEAALPRLVRGLMYATLRDSKSALSDLDAAIKLDPSNAEAYSYRGRLQAELGNVGQGYADLSEAVRLAPKNPEYRSYLGEVQHQMTLNVFYGQR